METSENTSEIVPNPRAEAPIDQSEQERKTRRIMIAVIAGVIILLAGLILAIVMLMQPTTPTDRIRDVFIIVVALESLVIGIALIILIVQLASLINLLQNEVRPILSSTSETVNNLRGTVEFLGENMVEPVIKLNGYLAGMNRVIELMGFKKK
jgi:ABC-type dipeptide/oligopeptide/nickel transport system permease component